MNQSNYSFGGLYPEGWFTGGEGGWLHNGRPNFLIIGWED